MFIMGWLPIRIEISSTGAGSQAQMQKRSILPPFNQITTVIPNLKQAVIKTSTSSKGGATYRVELEDLNGRRHPVTFYFSSGYKSKARTRDKINNAIKNKTEYSCVERHPFFIFFGFMFMVIPLIILRIMERPIPADTQEEQPKQNRYQRYKSVPQEIKRPQQSEPTESEKEKYKNINDSIIK